MIYVDLSDTPINSGEQAQADPASGAVVTFTGVTRSTAGAKTTVALEYEAYERLARRQMQDIAEQASRKWSLQSALVVHRTGVVPVGETGVQITAEASHRAAAFEACQWMIDTLKSDVAIWKRELYSDGSHQWLGQHK